MVQSSVSTPLSELDSSPAHSVSLTKFPQLTVPSPFATSSSALSVLMPQSPYQAVPSSLVSSDSSLAMSPSSTVLSEVSYNDSMILDLDKNLDIDDFEESELEMLGISEKHVEHSSTYNQQSNQIMNQSVTRCIIKAPTPTDAVEFHNPERDFELTDWLDAMMLPTSLMIPFTSETKVSNTQPNCGRSNDRDPLLSNIKTSYDPFEQLSADDKMAMTLQS
ncbi:uncharacterized protein LOC143235211 isoform X3 [Tachypleus tridentatus]